jgi:hypothetical protein
MVRGEAVSCYYYRTPLLFSSQTNLMESILTLPRSSDGNSLLLAKSDGDPTVFDRKVGHH